jgi:hypothetical protein
MIKLLYKKYKLKSLLTKENLAIIIHNFFIDIVNISQVTNNMKIRVLLTLDISNSDHKSKEYKSLGKMVFVDKNCLTEYVDYITYLLNLKSDYYTTSVVNSITFKYYKILSKDSDVIVNQDYYNTLKPEEFINTNMSSISGYDLPNNTFYESWGRILSRTQHTLLIYYNNFTMFVSLDKEKDSSLNINKVVLFQGKTKILSFIDKRFTLDYFTREINTRVYHYIKNEVIIIENKKLRFISKISTDKKLTNKYLTIDIETRKIGNTILPYLISYFDGKNKKSFYLSDYISENEMIKTCLQSLMIKKYNNHIIYAHNLSLFDSIFLLYSLSELINETKDFNIIKKDSNIILLEYRYVKNSIKMKIQFRDSFLILPVSLRKLAETLNNENDRKDIFPYEFGNKESALEYIGHVPEYNFFPADIDRDVYDKYIKKYNNDWSFKNESIKYCEQDCISLYNVIKNFNKIIYDLFQINIHKSPTLSSLAMRIYKSNYLFDDIKIPIIKGKMYKDIKQGFTGGATDLYIPYGENVKLYDVNSQYPKIMRDKYMPVGECKQFEGDIRKIDPNAFGFFEVEITSPYYIQHPIIQTRVRTDNGIKTISPIGTWKDIIFSEEMYNAENYGYKFKILRGYTYERKIIFSDYVDKLYKIKSSVEKSNPKYLISKLLQNSLFGRFSLQYDLPEHLLLTDKEFKDLSMDRLGNIDLLDTIELSNNRLLYSILDKNKYSNIEADDKFSKDISISISAAITAYARIFMSKFKNNPNFILLYTDTDSLFIIGDLPEDLIGKELGQFKVEYNFKKLVILSPKVYGGILDDGTEIIKVKGLKKDSINKYLTVDILESLLYKDTSRIIPNNKMYRSYSSSSIAIQNDLYTLKLTDNKRKLIYDNNNRFSSSESYVIDINKNIINK